MIVGDTFFLVTPHQNYEHLYIIAVVISPGNYLVINITSKEYDSDCACELVCGDHEFIKHDSVMEYSEALEITDEKLNFAIDMELARKSTPVSKYVIDKILSGACISESLPLKYRSLFNCP